MKVKVVLPTVGATGNILWCGRYPMRLGRFPKAHPVGGTHDQSDSLQKGTGENIQSFRARGYWASCFPEGDGITWRPLDGQTDAKCIADIRECFGWEI